MKHFIKSVNPSFDDMITGKKNFEILFDEKFNKYQIGDTLIFEEYDYVVVRTERVIERKIEYIFYPDYMLAGFIVVQFAPENS